MTIYVATSNAGKLRDFRAVANEFPGITIEPLPGLKDIPAPPEDEPTFEGNARIKAVYYSRLAPGSWVLADDSGLEVDALNGQPGVRSARYAEDLGQLNPAIGTDASNNATLLQSLDGKQDRTARYRCALALAMDGHVEAVSFGKVEGNILNEAAGEGGFGYDPYFFCSDLACSMAEAPMDDRMRVSHRGRALRNLLRKWTAC